MKTRLQYRLVIRLSVATMLALVIAITPSLNISRASAAPDDLDAVVQAAKDGTSSLNASNSAGVNAISSALENFAAAVAGLDKSADALAALVAEIQAVARKIEALRELIRRVRSQIERIDEKLDELKAKADALEQCTAIKRAVAEQYAKLIQQLQTKIAEAEANKQSTTSLKQELSTLQNKRDEELKKLAASCDKVISEVQKLAEQVKNTAKARTILDKLSVDRTKTLQLLQLIKTNNRTGLSEFLQREAGGGDFVISEAKALTEPLLIFRVDSISHCISVGSQCGGKSYLLSK